MKHLLTLLLALAIATNSTAGFKASIGPEVQVQTQEYELKGYDSNGNLFVQDSRTDRNDYVSARLNLGYDLNVGGDFGVDVTTSIDAYLTNRTELMVTYGINDSVTLKAGPSYTNILNKKTDRTYATPYGVTVGADIALKDNMFLDFKLNQTSYKSDWKNNFGGVNTSEASFFAGVGFGF